MFEEAQGSGVVPAFNREDEDFVSTIREFPPAAAEVMLLTWLRVVRRRTDAHGLDAPIPTMTIRVRADEEVVRMIKEQHMERSDHALSVDFVKRATVCWSCCDACVSTTVVVYNKARLS